MKKYITIGLLLLTSLFASSQHVNRWYDSTVFYKALTLVPGASNGKVLTSDAAGNATWQPDSALTLNLQQVTDNGDTTTNDVYFNTDASNYFRYYDYNGASKQLSFQTIDESIDSFGTIKINANVEEGITLRGIDAYGNDNASLNVNKNNVFISAIGGILSGTLTVSPNGTEITQGLTYQDGTQATGKVLTSDANGLASWQATAQSNGTFADPTTAATALGSGKPYILSTTIGVVAVLLQAITP